MAAAVQCHDRTLARLSVQHWASIVAKFAASKWTPGDVLYALDHAFSGRPHSWTTPVVHVAGWAKKRLDLWCDEAGRPLPSRSQQLAAEAETRAKQTVAARRAGVLAPAPRPWDETEMAPPPPPVLLSTGQNVGTTAYGPTMTSAPPERRVRADVPAAFTRARQADPRLRDRPVPARWQDLAELARDQAAESRRHRDGAQAAGPEPATAEALALLAAAAAEETAAALLAARRGAGESEAGAARRAMAAAQATAARRRRESRVN